MRAALTSDRLGHAGQCIAYASEKPPAGLNSLEVIEDAGGGAGCDMMRMDGG